MINNINRKVISMEDFLEFDTTKKTVKSLNLNDFSIEDLNDYINELEKEIKRANLEIEKKKKSINDAMKYFK
tara:strand:- start:1975 stop:2190 length:216 start_codon:yes stop_codon:yes gene_type:complete